MDLNIIIEIFAVVLGLIFIILIIRENIWGWLFGIISSALSVWLFLRVQLYSESILYFFYIIIGIYGWYTWANRGKDVVFKVSTWRFLPHLYAIIAGALLSFGLGTFFEQNSDAKNPFFDATTTIFSFIASYMEAQKILSAWLFWIVINGATIFLYHTRGLNYYSYLMFLYFILSFYGYYTWQKAMAKNKEQ